MIVSKERIEREAREAADNGLSLDHACPYPFHSAAGRHFRQQHAAALAARQTREEGQA